MELKFDCTKAYAVCLEGGGARGAYQIGAWEALKTAGVNITAAAGSSVGALNGALIAMDNLELAKELWQNMTFSKIMDVDDEQMKKLFSGRLLDMNLKSAFRKVGKVLRDGGFDVTPLKNLIRQHVNPEEIASSDVRLFICTHSLTDRKGLELEAKKLESDELCDMLLASAYFPAFKHEEIGGKRYTDGGVSNVLPLSPLIYRGYKDIITIRLFGLGIEKKITLPKGTTITEIAPSRDLGGMLNFDADACKKNYRLGYLDASRMLYGLYGSKYYIDRTLTENEAYKLLCSIIKKKLGKSMSLKQIHTELLRFSKELGASGDYYDMLIAVLERYAERFRINELQIYTDSALIKRISDSNTKKLRKSYEKG